MLDDNEVNVVVALTCDPTGFSKDNRDAVARGDLTVFIANCGIRLGGCPKCKIAAARMQKYVKLNG